MTVRQEISAVAIRPEIAALLRVKSGSPGLQMLRRYTSTQNETFDVTISIHPADRYQYTMQLGLAYSTGPVGLAPETGSTPRGLER